MWLFRERERGISGDDMCGCSERERERGLVVMICVVVQREREGVSGGEDVCGC